MPSYSCPAPHDEAGNTWHYSDQQLFDLTKHGVSALACGDYKTRMPAYAETLSDREIFAVLSYIKSQWPKRIWQRHDRLNAAARQAHSD